MGYPSMRMGSHVQGTARRVTEGAAADKQLGPHAELERETEVSRAVPTYPPRRWYRLAFPT